MSNTRIFIFGILRGFVEDMFVPVGLFCCIVVAFFLAVFYMSGNKSVPADALMAAVSQSPCVKNQLQGANERSEVITQRMLEDSLKRCESVADQSTAFDPSK